MSASRMLGLDVGSKRIGVSISDEFGWTAQPLDSIDATAAGEPGRSLQAYVSQYAVRKIVVGLPLNMDGSDSRQTKTVREFAERLQRRFPECAVKLWDERLTSQQGERIMGALNLKKRRKKTASDTIAAQLILQTYLEHRRIQAMDS